MKIKQLVSIGLQYKFGYKYIEVERSIEREKDKLKKKQLELVR